MRKFIPMVLLLFASPVVAKTTTYDWTGRATRPGWKIALDELVNGSIEIDDNAQETENGSNGISRTYTAARFCFAAAGENFASIQQREWFIIAGRQGFENQPVDTGTSVYYSFNWSVETNGNILDLFAANSLDTSWTRGFWNLEVNNPSNDYFADSFDGCIDKLVRREDPVDSAPVPEPSGLVLMGTALAAFSAYRRKRD